MKEKMLQYMKEKELLAPGDRIVLGVSGGADSVCLLHLLKACQQEWKLTLYVVHIHHGIRGGEADRDAAFVEELAARLSLPFFLVKGNVPEMAVAWGLSEEEAGRRYRYEELERIRAEQSADLIAVAHHRDDQAETVLFRLFRGSGVRGLAGMEPKRGRIIRPLLFAGRDEIRAYLRQRELSWCEDSTNEDSAYSRNRIRGQLLPLVEREINAQASRHIVDAAADIAAWTAYIDRTVEKLEAAVLVRQGDDELLLLSPFEKLDERLKDELLYRFVARGVPGARDITRVHYRQLRELIGRENGKRIDLPGKKTVEKCHDCLRLFGTEAEEILSQACEVPSVNTIEAEGKRYCIRTELKKREEILGKIPEKDYTKWFDYDKIKGGLVLRNPREGDFFIMDREGHRKKLSHYYRDCRMPLGRRRQQMVLADGSHVLWAIPGRISEFYKITECTKRVMTISITEKDDDL